MKFWQKLSSKSEICDCEDELSRTFITLCHPLSLSIKCKFNCAVRKCVPRHLYRWAGDRSSCTGFVAPSSSTPRSWPEVVSLRLQRDCAFRLQRSLSSHAPTLLQCLEISLVVVVAVKRPWTCNLPSGGNNNSIWCKVSSPFWTVSHLNECSWDNTNYVFSRCAASLMDVKMWEIWDKIFPGEKKKWSRRGRKQDGPS